MAETQCRYFTGYKPCGLSADCHPQCPHRDVPQQRILFIHLGAMGAVVRSTSLLSGLHQKHPRSSITWVTRPATAPLLTGHPLIDRVWATGPETHAQIALCDWDAVYCVDKSLAAITYAAAADTSLWFGFRHDAVSGAILPATEAARELWELGLDDHQKFHVNRKPEVQLLREALEIGSGVSPYSLPMTRDEKREVERRRRQWLHGKGSLVGFNTGCADTIPYKRLTVEFQVELIRQVQEQLPVSVVLLGGPEDSERNGEIAKRSGAVATPTDRGVRDGYLSVAACDVVVTGDSLGMHLAIAAERYVVAWFGPTCAHEIELYGRGEKILTKAACSPCWKRQCSQNPMCYDQVDAQDIMGAIRGALCPREGPLASL